MAARADPAHAVVFGHPCVGLPRSLGRGGFEHGSPADSPLEFARRAGRLYPQREAVVDGACASPMRSFSERCDRWSAALQRLGRRPRRPGGRHRPQHPRDARAVLRRAAARSHPGAAQLPPECCGFPLHDRALRAGRGVRARGLHRRGRGAAGARTDRRQAFRGARRARTPGGSTTRPTLAAAAARVRAAGRSTRPTS